MSDFVADFIAQAGYEAAANMRKQGYPTTEYHRIEAMASMVFHRNRFKQKYGLN